MFLDHAKPTAHSTVVDYGCGTGRAGKKLYEAGLDVTLLDFAYNALDKSVKRLCKDNNRLRFVEHDLTEPTDFPSEWYDKANVINFEYYTTPYERCGDMLIVYLSNVAPDYTHPIQTMGYSTGGKPATIAAPAAAIPSPGPTTGIPARDA